MYNSIQILDDEIMDNWCYLLVQDEIKKPVPKVISYEIIGQSSPDENNIFLESKSPIILDESKSSTLSFLHLDQDKLMEGVYDVINKYVEERDKEKEKDKEEKEEEDKKDKEIHLDNEQIISIIEEKVSEEKNVDKEEKEKVSKEEKEKEVNKTQQLIHYPPRYNGRRISWAAAGIGLSIALIGIGANMYKGKK